MHELTITNTPIRQDSEGRYCLNDLHKASGGAKRHRPSYWLANKQTKFKSFYEALTVVTDRKMADKPVWREAYAYCLEHAPSDLKKQIDEIQRSLFEEFFPDMFVLKVQIIIMLTQSAKSGYRNPVTAKSVTGFDGSNLYQKADTPPPAGTGGFFVSTVHGLLLFGRAVWGSLLARRVPFDRSVNPTRFRPFFLFDGKRTGNF